LLQKLARTQPNFSPARALSRHLPARLAGAILSRLKMTQAPRMNRLDRDSRRKLSTAIASWPLEVTGSRGYNYAEVTAGGVPLSEVNPSTLESRRCPGLHLIGEILDVDGRLGGFNFQWAWSTAAVAAHGLAKPNSAFPFLVRP